MGTLRAAKFLTYMQLNHPSGPGKIEKDGWKLVFLGKSSRSAYKVKGTSLVIKFPDIFCFQAKAEIRALRNVHKYKKYQKIRKYAPNLYYGNLNTGVVVMDYLKEIIRPTRNQKIQWSHVTRILSETLKCPVDDGSYGGPKNKGEYMQDFDGQYGYTKSGQIKLYDWGFPAAADF